MKIWILDIFEENLDDILAEGKEVEGRVPDPTKPEKRYYLIKPGDQVQFRVVDKNIKPIPNIINPIFEVIYNHKYKTVEQYLRTEGLKRAIPKINTLEEGIASYLNLPKYKERIEANGIFGIGLGKRIE